MFFDIYCYLCEQKGVSKNKAATEIGLSNSTVTKWKKTKATPDSSTLSKVAKYFGVTIDFLLGTTPESYLAWSEYRLAKAKKEYERETDQAKLDELALEIDAFTESISDQKLSIALIDLGKNKKTPTAQSDGLQAVLQEVTDLLQRATPELRQAVLETLRASVSPRESTQDKP